MDFEWDDAKNRLNIEKHHLSFENAKRVFDDPLHRSVFQGYADGEERWETTGMIAGLVVVVVVSTPRLQGGEEITRIISARRATKRERKAYEEEIG
jgi:uncharacterized protein